MNTTHLRRIADLDPQSLQRVAGRGELANVAVPPRDCNRDIKSSIDLYMNNKSGGDGPQQPVAYIDVNIQSLSYSEVARANQRTSFRPNEPALDAPSDPY